MVKIYTKTGDGGLTSLFGGARVPKGNVRVEAYGSVDELNAYLGWAGTLLPHLSLQERLREVQSDLFVVGADLAAAPGASRAALSHTLRVKADHSRRLEAWIDEWDAECEPLSSFILPGGSPGAAALHVCRAACRRAERCVSRLAHIESVNPEVIVYLNRLSDLLFVLARWVNRREDVTETAWKGAHG